MKQLTIIVVAIAAAIPAGAAMLTGGEAPRVEVAFVLDTTGSMGGLLQGAKDKIWWIANQIIAAEPSPDLRVALVPYRDRGDEYVTRIHDLSDDIDEVYQRLQEFQASGGGDGPEHVNQALDDAVRRVSWSSGDRVLRIVFLVGDAPPHMDYDDGLDYRQTCRIAAREGIIVNTIRCGAWAETEQVWQEIARLAEGRYASIDQSGGVTVTETPFDEELAELNRALEDTYVAYGREERRDELEAASVLARSMPAPMAAERAGFVGKKGKAAEAEVDLVTAAGEGRVDLADMAPEDLPQELRELPPEKREKVLAAKRVERDEVRTRIAEVAAQRSAHLTEEAKKKAPDGPEDGFDQEVVNMLRDQAGKVGLKY